MFRYKKGQREGMEDGDGEDHEPSLIYLQDRGSYAHIRVRFILRMQ